MSVDIGLDARIECELPALPSIGLFVTLPIFEITWPPVFSINFNFSFKCPDLGSAYLARLGEKLNFMLPAPRIPALDVARFGKSISLTAAGTFDNSSKRVVWSRERKVW